MKTHDDQTTDTAESVPAATADLTPWQALPPVLKEVARRLALGATCPEIASAHGVETKTVDSQRQTVLKRLRVRNNVELARYALRHGYVTLDVEDEVQARRKKAR